RERGVRTREAYLAKMASRPKPWIAEGISHSTWKRRRAGVTRGVKQTIVTKVASDLGSSEERQGSKKGLQEGGGGVGGRVEDGKAETIASSSPELDTHPRPPLKLEDPRLAAMLRWGRAAEVVTTEVVKERWTKPTIIADEPRDFDEFPLKETDVA